MAAANKVKFVYANDLNPTAVVYLQHNLALNKLAHKAEVTIPPLKLTSIPKQG